MTVLARLRHWMRSKPAPVLWPKGAETCPVCGRPIPGALAPPYLPGPATRWPWSRIELTAMCPIDGALRRTHQPEPTSVADLREAAGDLAGDLRAKRDVGWAKYFEAAVHQEADDDFLTLMGHALAVLIRRGPVSDLNWPIDELEQLLVDTVGHWRPAD